MDNREGTQPEPLRRQPNVMQPTPHEPLNGVPPTEAAPRETDAPDEPAGIFTSWNLSLLGFGVCLVFFILWKFTFIEIWAIVKAGLGLSFVIFIHELGHFLAAKWCGVNVTTFSIGFGPPIPGCWFAWGETTYKLAILPLGGYVQMVGQVDGDEGSDDADDPRSYRKKTVPQRMLIISAGVIMNAILAMFCFIAIYNGDGKEHAVAAVNHVDTLAPAFEKGIATGAHITRIDNVEKPNFSDFTQLVINTQNNQFLEVTGSIYRNGKEESFTKSIEPRMDENNKKPIIGISTPPKLQLVPKRGLSEGPYYAKTSAADAKFHYGDVIIAMSDPGKPNNEVTELPIDPRDPNQSQRDYFVFLERLQLLADKDVTIRVRRKIEKDGKDAEVIVDLSVKPMYRQNLGAVMQMGPVKAIREGSSAHGKIQTAGDLEADLIQAVSVADGGKETVWRDKPVGNDKQLDPERLPFELRQWFDKADPKAPRQVSLHVRRHKRPDGAGKPQYEYKTIVLDWDANWRFDRAAPISLNAPMPIPELGLAYEIKTIVHAVTNPKSNLKVGDVIKNMRYDVEGFAEELPWLRKTVYSVLPFTRPELDTDIKVDWMKVDLKEGQWANISFQVFQRPYKFKKLVLKVERDKQTEEVEIPIAADTTWPIIDRGWHFASDTRRVTASDPLNAIWLGTIDTKNRMTEIFLNLRGMILGRIALSNLGGPLTIAHATYRFAGMDFTDFMFFIGLISINLAVVNFLPIPVLDGGHMVFLIYEGIRKRPASEMVRIVATYIGLAIILLLMIFVLSLDFIRIFFSS